LDGAPWLLARPARDLDLIPLMLVLRRASAAVPVSVPAPVHRGQHETAIGLAAIAVGSASASA
jgi:hypothetical protein